MQVEQTRRLTRPAGGRIVAPVLLALSYAFLLPALHAQQGGGSGILTQTSAVQPSKQDNQNAPAMKPSRARLVNAYAHLPLSFEANRGQAPSEVQFLARGQGFTLFLAGDEAVLALKKPGVRSQESGQRTTDAFLRMKIVGADPAAVATGAELLPGQVNYFLGNDAAKWRTHIPTYRQAVYRNIYPGVDLVYYGRAGQLEYDFRVNPGASPDAIGMALDGASQAWLTPSGDLALSMPSGEVRLEKPVAYQLGPRGEKQFVDAGFLLQSGKPQTPNLRSQIHAKQFVDARFAPPDGQSRISNLKSQMRFRLGSYDPSRVLVIDPTLTYSTYLGGAGADSAFGVALDSSGDAYITGQTTSTDFPVSSGTFQSKFGTKTATCPNGAPATDAFVAEVNPEGSALVYSTYLGGEGCDAASGIYVDPLSGSAYVTGNTNSSHFPISPAAVQTTPGGGVDVFVTEVAADGASLAFSTFFGGAGDDYGTAIVASPSAAVTYVCVTGSTASQTVNKAVIDNFPVTNHPLQPNFGGGTTDAFFFELTATPKMQSATIDWAILYSTYLGGLGADSASAIALDAENNIYIAGVTASPDFPVITSSSSTPFQKALNGTSDAFISEFSAPVTLNPCVGAAPCQQSNLLVSTYLGGSAADAGNGIALDSSGNVYAVGNTSSTDFPLQNPTASNCPAMSSALQSANGGGQDAFVTKLAPGGGCLSYSTYLGGSGSDSATGVAVDSAGDALVTGNTQSSSLFGSSGGNATASGSIQSACATSVTSSGAAAGCDDAFIASLNPTGDTLNYGTFLGGGLHDQGNAIAVDPTTGDAYLAGVTESTDFPIMAAAFQNCFGGPSVTAPTPCPTSTATTNAFVAKVSVAAAPVQVLPTVLPFGVEAVTGTSAPQTVAVTNNSGSPLSFTSITASAGFAVSSMTCSTSTPLADGSSCTVAVTFTPTAVGSMTGTLTLSDSASGSPQTVSLAGTGVNVAATVSPTSLTFSSQSLGTSSVPQAVTLSNSGSSPLTISSIAITAGSAFIETNNCGSTLAAASNCTIEVSFTPTAVGAASDTLTITDDAPNSPQTVRLSGTGSSSSLSLSAANLNFGSVVINTKTTSQSLVVTNTGDTAVSITSVSISGANATSFTLSSKSPCAPSLGVGSACTIAINFKPLTSGSLSATLSIANNAPGSPQTVALAGLGGDFGAASSPTSATVNPGQSATFTVTVTPIGGFNNEVTLTCTGQPTYGACSVSPATVTPNGTTAVTTTVTVTTLAPARLAPPYGRFLPPTVPLGLAFFERTGLVWLLVGLLGVAVAAASKRRRSRMLLAATLALALFWIGCTASGNPNNPANNGTPPGAYQVTITGASSGLSHGVTVTVNVNT